MLNTFTLKNGLKVATYSIPEMRSVFLNLSVKGGSIFDTKEKCGVAHFMEHMLVQGIPSLPNVDLFSSFIEGLSGSYNALTYSQQVKFIASVPNNHLKDILKIGSEVFFEPLFPADALERERQAVLEEIRQNQDGVGYKNSKFFAKTRYKKGHPLLLDGGGAIETVTKLIRDDLVKYWSDFFYPKNTYLTLVGGFDKDAVKEIICEYFEKYNAPSTFPGFAKITNDHLSNRRVAIRFDPKLKTCYIDLTFPSISDEKPIFEHVRQSTVKSILGGLRRSRLYSLLRQKRGLVYDVGAGSLAFPYFGYMYIYSQVAVEKLDEVIDLISKELVSLYQGGVTQEELDYAKNYAINRTLMQFDHPSAIGEWISNDLMWEDKVYTPEEYVEIIKKVTLNNVNEFMRDFWDFSKLNLTIQGPVKSSEASVKKFEELVEVIK